MTRQIVLGELPQARREQILIVYDNAVLGRKGATVSADSEAVEGNMGAENLLSESRSDMYRSGSVATRSLQAVPEIVVTHFLGVINGPKDVDWVSLHWTNLHVPWRVELWAGDPDAGGTLLQDSGWINAIVKSTLADFPYYDEFPWSLGPSEKRVSELATDMRLGSFWHFAQASFGVSHVRIRFNVADGTNGTVDFLQIGLPFIGRAWQPSINASMPVRLEPVSRSIIHRSAGGAKTGLFRTPNVEFQFSLDHLTDEEGFELFEDWMLREGEFARVLMYVHPEADQRRYWYSGPVFVGAVEAFEALAVESEPGDTGDIYASRAVTGISVQETE